MTHKIDKSIREKTVFSFCSMQYIFENKIRFFCHKTCILYDDHMQIINVDVDLSLLISTHNSTNARLATNIFVISSVLLDDDHLWGINRGIISKNA